MFSRQLRFYTPVFLSLLLGVGFLASTVISVGASRVATSYINENWRGSYDILVLPKDDTHSFMVDHLVEPNYLGTTSGKTITEDDLEKIRALPNVDLAAPVALIGNLLEDKVLDVNVGLAAPADAEQLYMHKTMLALTRQDSLSKTNETLFATSFYSLAFKKDRMACRIQDLLDMSDSFLTQSNSTGVVEVGRIIPWFVSPFVAVDPVAEQKILGKQGKFLSPLLPYAEMKNWPTDIKISDLSSEDKVIPILSAKNFPLADNKFMVEMQDDVSTQPLQLAKAQTIFKHFTDESGHLEKEIRDAKAEIKTIIESGALQFKPYLDKQSKDITNVVDSINEPGESNRRRFAAKQMTVTQAATAATLYQLSHPEYISQPVQQNGKTQTGVIVKAKGISQVLYMPSAADKDLKEQSYRVTSMVSTPHSLKPVTVGFYDLTDLPKDDGAAVSAPLGAYHNAPVVGADGKELRPNLNGKDFFMTLPGQITTLAMAKLMLGYTPIDAVRVRLANLSADYGTGIVQVYKTIAQIKRLGLEAYAVAGSSPSKQLLVLENREIKDNKVVGNLGPVSQEWSYLAAAGAVIAAIGFGKTYLGAMSFLTVIFSLLLVAALQGRQRRIEVAVLRQIGYSEKSIIKTLMTLPLTMVATIVCFCGISLVIEPSTNRLLASAVAVFFGLLAGIWYVWAGLTLSRLRRKCSSRPTGGAFGLFVKRVWRAPGPFLLVVAGYWVLALAVNVVMALVVKLSTMGGNTRLNEHVSTQVAAAIGALCVISLGACLLIAWLGSRQINQLRAREFGVFRILGIKNSVLLRAVILETALIAMVSLGTTYIALLLATHTIKILEILNYKIWLLSVIPVLAVITHCLASVKVRTK